VQPAITVDDFALTVSAMELIEAKVDDRDPNVGKAMREAWGEHLRELGFPVEEAFTAVCLQAWELR
jgi:hypothetical protein